MTESLTEHSWWNYIEEDLRELLREATLLADRVEDWNEKFHDYSFIVFPAAKAYEGFLKKLFLDKGFISDKSYYGKRFRVGKALNPALEKRYRKFGVYDKLAEFCGGTELPNQMWETWTKGRNLLFHWFPNEKNAIEFEEAREIISQIIDTMDLAYRECKIE
jgi:hypothetical protein